MKQTSSATCPAQHMVPLVSHRPLQEDGDGYSLELDLRRGLHKGLLGQVGAWLPRRLEHVRGPQFSSQLWREFVILLGIKLGVYLNYILFLYILLLIFINISVLVPLTRIKKRYDTRGSNLHLSSTFIFCLQKWCNPVQGSTINRPFPSLEKKYNKIIRKTGWVITFRSTYYRVFITDKAIDNELITKNQAEKIKSFFWVNNQYSHIQCYL